MRSRVTIRRAKAKWVCGALGCLALAYVAAPYVCLWRLYHAVQQGDADTLAQVVDWDSVRQGLKEDISEGIIGLPPTEALATGDSLPAFGSGFVNGIASNVVDQQVTPQHLAAALHDPQPELPPTPPTNTRGSFGALERAFFTGPTSFAVSIRLPGQAPEDFPLRVELGLCGTSWKVIRAWIPQDLMDQAKFHT